MKFFTDSSGWIALFDPDDKRYVLVHNWMREISEHSHRLVTTDYILDETITHLVATIHHNKAESFAVWVLAQKRIQIVHVDEELWDEALALFRRYDDKEFSFTDCTSFVVMQHHKIRDAFAFDRHFEQMGFRLWP
jgi:predicted nucleic acid-binding protein